VSCHVCVCSAPFWLCSTWPRCCWFFPPSSVWTGFGDGNPGPICSAASRGLYSIVDEPFFRPQVHQTAGLCIHNLKIFFPGGISHQRDGATPSSTCLDPTDTNFRLARQRSHCSCFTKRPLLTTPRSTTYSSASHTVRADWAAWLPGTCQVGRLVRRPGGPPR